MLRSLGRRFGVAFVGAVVVLAVAAPAALAGSLTEPPPTEGLCSRVPTDFLRNYCDELKDNPTNPFAPFKAVVRTVVGDKTRDVTQGWSEMFAEWGQEKLRQMFAFIERTTTPELRAGWFVAQYRTNAAIAFGLSTLLALFTLIIGLKKRNPRIMAGGIGGIVEFAGLVALIPWATIGGLMLVDAIGHQMLQNVGPNVARFVKTVGDATAVMPELRTIMALVATFFVAVGAFLIWVCFTAREALIYLSVVLGCLVAVMTILPNGGVWTKRLTGWLCTLGLMKIVAIGAISIAFALFGGIRSGQAGVDDVVWAGGFLVGAGIAPWWLPKLAPWAAMLVGTSAMRSGHDVTRSVNSGRQFLDDRKKQWAAMKSRAAGANGKVAGGSAVAGAATGGVATAAAAARVKAKAVKPKPYKPGTVYMDFTRTGRPPARETRALPTTEYSGSRLLAATNPQWPSPMPRFGRTGLPSQGAGGAPGTRPGDYGGGKSGR
jgi:hypothetical protein